MNNNSGLGADTREDSVRQARDTPCDVQTANQAPVQTYEVSL